MSQSLENLAQQFPPDFFFGSATASYQIEGAWNEEGKGESIWDRFSHTPGKILNGDTGDVACDHYHRWREDIHLMKGLGLNAYRFSIAWPRILPLGRGRVNPAGMDFYSRLVDGLLEAGIEPFATLYHWDLPQALQDEGGWPARSTADAFVEYADAVTRRLGDRVKYWATLNEPFVSATIGYLEGVHAPGHQDVDEMLATSHHLLLAHGLALPVIRSNSAAAQAGIVLNLGPQTPASNSAADLQAARVSDGMINRWYLDPLSGRGYPGDIVKHFDRPMDFIRPGDLEAIAAPLDYLGINYYTRTIVHSTDIPESENEPRQVWPNSEITDMGWEVYPEGLYEILSRVQADYPYPALYIAENGAAFPDPERAPADGQVHDEQRTRYLQAHFACAARAIAAGIPLRGYFVWSLLDNFEWSFGYTRRFGITHIDFDILQRTLKDSGKWYQELIASHHRQEQR